jgi:hypothetical protein
MVREIQQYLVFLGTFRPNFQAKIRLSVAIQIAAAAQPYSISSYAARVQSNMARQRFDNAVQLDV